MSEAIQGPNDQATMPADMLALNAPSGTIMYELGIRKETEINRFGVKDMALGLIRTFDEELGTPTDYKEGTYINFEPGHIHAYVARRGLTGEEINQIGLACARIDNAQFVSQFLPNIIEQTENTIKGLKTLAVARADIQSPEDIDTQLEKDISNLGITLEQLKTNQAKQPEVFLKLAEAAYKLGVTVIFSKTGSTRDGSTPIALLFRDKSKKQTAEI